MPVAVVAVVAAIAESVHVEHASVESVEVRHKEMAEDLELHVTVAGTLAADGGNG